MNGAQLLSTGRLSKVNAKAIPGSIRSSSLFLHDQGAGQRRHPRQRVDIARSGHLRPRAERDQAVQGDAHVRKLGAVRAADHEEQTQRDRRHRPPHNLVQRPVQLLDRQPGHLRDERAARLLEAGRRRLLRVRGDLEQEDGQDRRDRPPRPQADPALLREDPCRPGEDQLQTRLVRARLQ